MNTEETEAICPKCGYKELFEPCEFGLTYYQAIGTCPVCETPTVYADGSLTAIIVTFKLTGNE